jgi:hypothetical protein
MFYCVIFYNILQGALVGGVLSLAAVWWASMGSSLIEFTVLTANITQTQSQRYYHAIL